MEVIIFVLILNWVDAAGSDAIASRVFPTFCSTAPRLRSSSREYEALRIGDPEIYAETLLRNKSWIHLTTTYSNIWRNL